MNIKNKFMFGIASHEYPLFVFKKHQKKVINPITKKDFVIRPEELVRLQWIEASIHTLKWNRTRIASEQSMLTAYQTNSLRADLVLFDNHFKPELLIECKANSVELSNDTDLQAGLYNTELDAPKIVLTNGIRDLYFEKMKTGWISSSIYSLIQSDQNEYQKDIDYWIDRAFLGRLIDRQSFKPFSTLLVDFFGNRDSEPARYRSFSQSIGQLDISHYYTRLTDSLYLSVLADHHGKTYIVLLQTHSNQIQQIGIIDLDALLVSASTKMVIFAKGQQNHIQLPVEVVRLFQEGVLSSETQLALYSLFNLG